MKIPTPGIALFVALGVGFVTAPKAGAQLKIGIFDFNRAFTGYRKTQEAEARLEEARKAAAKEFNERADAYKNAVDGVSQINQQLDGPALSTDAKSRKAEERDAKIEQIKRMEREITEFRQTREKQLQEQMLRSKEEIVREITGVVLKIARSKELDLVFDKSGPSYNGFSPLLYSRDVDDFTGAVIAALANEKSETNSSPSPPNRKSP